MPKPISEYKDPNALRNLMDNARRLKRDDVWKDAFRKLCELEGADQYDPLSCKFYQMLTAYEELLSLKNGRKTAATRTRQKLRNKGMIQCLEDWALDTKPTQGFDMLVGNGLFELTGEYIVLQYPDRFTTKAVASARARLEKMGIVFPTQK